MDQFVIKVSITFCVNFILRLSSACLCCGLISAGSPRGHQTRILELLFQMVERGRHHNYLYVSAVLHSVAECMGVLQRVEAKKICIYRGWCNLRQRYGNGLFPPSPCFPDQFGVGSFTAVALQNAERCAEVSCHFSAPVHCVCYWGGQDILVLCCFADQTERIERQPRLPAVSSLRQVRIVKGILLNRMTVSTEQNRPFATNDHMVQNPPCWRALLKTKASQAWLVGVSLFQCPSAGIIMSLPSSMADFVPSDRLLQKAY